jgi:hypothetical protein
MKRYFFDLRDGETLAADEEGVELPNLQRAQEEAARSLAEMARERGFDADAGGAHDAHDMAIEVRDDDGPVMKLMFLFFRTEDGIEAA